MFQQPESRSNNSMANLELLIEHLEQRIEGLAAIKEQPGSSYRRRTADTGLTTLEQFKLLDMAKKRYTSDLDDYRKGRVYGD